MELAYGRIIFDTYGQYAADPAAIADMLEAAVADMQARAATFAGRQRDHTPTRAHPFTVVLVDEVAFLTAYQPDRNLKARISGSSRLWAAPARTSAAARSGSAQRPLTGYELARHRLRRSRAGQRRQDQAGGNDCR